MVTTYRYSLPRLLLDTDIAVPNSTYDDNKTAGPYGDSSFDSNMVIILAALLCALVCALGLNSIVRLVLRCRPGGGFAYDASDEVAGHLGSSGLTKEALSRIPVAVYKPGRNNIIPSTDCPICLGEFVEGEDVRVLPRCNHGFHVKCIDRWLVLHSSCPTCREPLLDGDCTSSGNEEEHVDVRV